MADKLVLRSKVLNEATRIITICENEKGSKELDPLLKILRSLKEGLTKKNGKFVSPKIEKTVSELRTQILKIID